MWVLIIHIVAWIFQFIGHGVFESKVINYVERKPALLDNLTQILNAPLFVIVEIFEMVGLQSS
jgi:2-hydroxy fatty acid dioxygenase